MGETKVLVLGASGMLGHALLRWFAAREGFDVRGTVRSLAAQQLLPAPLRGRVTVGIDIEDRESLRTLLERDRPDVIVNCIGLIKQLALSHDQIAAITINSLVPHILARACESSGSRLIHISTDCVFAGSKGMYREADVPDATDLYGRSKCLGEVDYPHAVTLRTSIIGHELQTSHGLIGWFLSQSGRVKGFTRAIFSGLPTVELAKVIGELVIPRTSLRGVYHVSAAPISKYDLLKLVAEEYGIDIVIEPDDKLSIDRSLDSTRFRALTGYEPPPWPDLVRAMHQFS